MVVVRIKNGALPILKSPADMRKIHENLNAESVVGFSPSAIIPSPATMAEEGMCIMPVSIWIIRR
jgi:hypothetical protein